MRESTRALLVLAVMVAIGAVTWIFFFKPFLATEPKVRDVINANSTWSVTLQEYHLEGLLSEETYRISNDNGKTTLFYAATNRAKTVTKEFTAPIAGPSGTFLFEDLRADGIWELEDRAVRPHPLDEYVVEVDQTLGDEGGTRSFSFSDPKYWATTKAQEFNLKLPPSGPISGPAAPAMGVAGRSLREPRYLQIVDAIHAFGPPSVLNAEARIRSQLAATALHPILPR